MVQFSNTKQREGWLVFVLADHVVTCMLRDVGDWFCYCSCGDNWTLDGHLCDQHLAESARAHVVAKSTEKLLIAFPETLKWLIDAAELCEEIETFATTTEAHTALAIDRAKKARERIERVLSLVHSEATGA